MSKIVIEQHIDVYKDLHAANAALTASNKRGWVGRVIKVERNCSHNAYHGHLVEGDFVVEYTRYLLPSAEPDGGYVAVFPAAPHKRTKRVTQDFGQWD